MKKTYAEGIMEIMSIIGDAAMIADTVKNEGAVAGSGAHVQSTISTINSTIDTSEPIFQIESPIKPVGKIAPKELVTVYDGQGHVISTNGKSATTGYVKGRKKSTNLKDAVRAELLDAAEVVLNRAFPTTLRNKVEGIVVRLADADYTVKCAGHVKLEFSDREADFTPKKSYITRGTVENHSAAIAKILVSEFENENPCASFGGFENGNSITLLDIKAGAIRFEIENPNGLKSELTFKITKKRARVVAN